MRSWLFLFVISQLPCPGSAQAAVKEGAPLYLELGEQRLIQFPGIDRYSISGDSVRYTRIANESGLLLKAAKPGTSTLYLATSGQDRETHLIRVVEKKARAEAGPLLQALNHLQTTEVVDSGAHFILRGEVKTHTEAQAIAYIRENFPSQILDETRIETLWLTRSQKEIQKVIDPYPSLSLESHEGALAVHGGLSNPALKDSVAKQIKSIQPLTQIDLQTVKDYDPTIHFKIFLLEVKKEAILSLGVDWPGTLPAALNLSPLQLLVSNSLDLTIHALSQKGLARVLSSPEVSMKAPGQAELQEGGELPIRERSKFSDNVIWKTVGLSLKIEVKEFGGDKVRLAIETEMSHLDQAFSNDNIPGVRTNRIKTLVDGVFDKPLLLSGLLQEDMHQTAKGLPILSQIPVLGPLFASEDYQNSRSEFVAILVPHRQTPSNPLTRISSDLPKGYLPVPRNEKSASEIENAKANSSYPWNVL